MAASSLSVEAATPAEVPQWLKSMPLAPEYRPTLAEFQDPISYIFKIEKEASLYGICKIVPPVQPLPRKTVISNLNRSLAARSSISKTPTPKPPPTFTTRQQQIGFCPRKPRPVQKPVWQSGQTYTYPQFEAKAKSFEKGYLKKCTKKGPLSALDIESLYWKATLDKPFSVEYANDMPGSAFGPAGSKKWEGEGTTVGETAWNMRSVSRGQGSLLRFMKEEIPGVTSPMVYLAMLFSWFAWHAEDHDLHSLNYLHMGAAKTWYGVPRDAAVAFEEVVRVHGYNGEVNPLVTFTTMGEKTTVISPVVFIEAGVPCCRLVQNPGEFVVTFPRAYHTGFSHGFNCAEASNIATPEWLRVANDAAIRRASMNYPPMVSHFQLLYDLALELCSRKHMSTTSNPRSSRLKDKKKGKGETLVKELFVQNVIQNNDLMHLLGNGSPIVLLPQSSSDISVCSDLRVGSQIRVNSRMHQDFASDDVVLDRNQRIKPVKGFYSAKGKFVSLYERKRLFDGNTCTSGSRSIKANNERETAEQGDGLSDQRLFSCVTCGILSFACVAIVQPREPAAGCLMSANCSFFNDWAVGSGITSDGPKAPGWVKNTASAVSFDIPVQSADNNRHHVADETNVVAETRTSALGLLAMTYGNCSDSDEDDFKSDVCAGDNMINSSSHHENSDLVSLRLDFCGAASEGNSPSLTKGESDRGFDCSEDIETDNLDYAKSNRFHGTVKEHLTADGIVKESFPVGDEDSSRLHIFCLEHAVEVEQQLRPIGGAHIMILCHPEYPKIEAEAKVAAIDLGIDHIWNNISFSDASKEDEEIIQSALDSEEVSPGNGDWAVKLGINLFYSANLSRSPLYSKQMPYNYVIYNAFGCNSLSTELDNYGRKSGKFKKGVAGKWCRKVWMSNEVHPFLVKSDPADELELFRAPDENLERKPLNTPKCKNPPVTTRKVARKRKITTDNTRPTKKVKRIETVDAVSDYSLEDNTYDKHFTKIIETDDAISNKSLEGNCHTQHRSKKQDKCLDGEIPCDAANRGSSLIKQYTRRVPKGAGLNNTPAVNSQRQSGRISVRKQTKFTEAEDEESDDALNNNHIQRGRITVVCKPVKCVDGEYAVSDDSLDDNSYDHPRGNSRTREANFTENTDPEVSEDALEDNFLQQHHQEDACSYDSLDSNSHQQRKRTSGNKRDKFFEMVVPRKRRGKSMKMEDDFSYDSLEDNSHQQQRKGSRKKQNKCFDRDDAISYDSDEYSNRKVAKRIERDVSVSDDDSLEERRLGSKKTKAQNLRQKTSRRPMKQEPQFSSVRSVSGQLDSESEGGGPSTRLRKRTIKAVKPAKAKAKQKKQAGGKKNASAGQKNAKINEEGEYQCDMEGCVMSFGSKQELLLHKRNICPVKGCGKKFFSHKYLVQHRRVHVDDRPLKCPWKGCKMTFKWAWARTEHIRVHTGARPYVCGEAGCGQTFRFVSDFSRHKRKTGHSVKNGKN